MTERQPTDATSADVAYEVELKSQEAALIRTSLLLLLSTLGREEADEIEEIKALLARFPAAPPSGNP